MPFAGILLGDRSTRIAVICGIIAYPDGTDVAEARAAAERRTHDAAGPNYSACAIVVLRAIFAGDFLKGEPS